MESNENDDQKIIDLIREKEKYSQEIEKNNNNNLKLVQMINRINEQLKELQKMGLRKNLYAKKIIFNRVTDINTLLNVHHSYLYDYGITGDDMIQLEEKDKNNLLTNFNKEINHIYLIKEEYIPIESEKIEVVEKSTTSNNWAYPVLPINEITDWKCIGNIEWKNRDDTGFHLNELYRKQGDKFIHEPNSKCDYFHKKFTIAMLVEGLFDKQLKNSFLFADVDN